MSGPAQRARQRKVLFLIADTGAGHRSAANAIYHAMGQLADAASPAPLGDWEADIIDVFVECSRFPLRNGVFLYGPAIKYSPRLYGRFFRMTNTTPRYRMAIRLARPFVRQGLIRLFQQTEPDVVVSVHPLLNHITLQVLRDLDVTVPLVTVVTDLIDLHCSWTAPGVAACVVPTETAARLAVRAGVPPRRVHLLGMPIHPKFALPPAGERAALRAKLGLATERPVVLLVGGGEGAIGLAAAATALGHSDLDAQLVVVTGRNRRLLARLERERGGFCAPAQLLGFVQNMPDLMRAADLVVTKAGPGTIMEAAACGLPIVLTGAVPGQEEGNVAFVVENGLGVLAPSPGAVVAAVRACLANGGASLRAMRANAARVSRPAASRDIAALVRAQIPPPGAPSPWERPGRVVMRRYDVGHMARPANPLRRRSTGRAPLPVGGPGRILRRWRGAGGRPRRPTGPGPLRGARALLLGGNPLGNVQLRRAGGRRRRDDARAPYRRGRR
jgi:1,2-diacylglycerol 3-beta-galactosyltransferase